jgi:pimeloyl-ACP methyl ester carboxylesterase
MVNHYSERILEWKVGRRVRAILSRSSRRTVVFIHGYGGDPIGTWSDFHELLPMEPRAADCDLIFYDYDGLRADLMASAEIFRDFLDHICTRPSTLINPSLPGSAARSRIFEYRDVVIVAHSLGAVIARWAMLEAHQTRKPWISKIQLVLFAPAHMGANVVKLALSVISGFPFLALAGCLMRFKSPLIDQLNKNSDELRALRQETARALKAGNCNYLVARRVIHAEYEKIVSNMKFCLVPPAIPFGGDHFSICKPKGTFLDPIQQVVEVL